jgi:hypothetical protein
MKVQSKWNKETVTTLLMSNSKAVEHAILVVYKNQTADEQRSETVKYHNGEGFLPMHARRGTYYANWINSGKHLNGRHLEIARTMTLKYTRQLIDAINAKGNN